MPANFNNPKAYSLQRFIALILFVISLVCLIVYCHEGEEGFIHGVQNAVLNVSGRSQNLSSSLGGSVSGALDSAEDVNADPETMSALREQNEQLRKLLSDSEEYRQEAERLRSLLDMKQVSGITGVTARIIGRGLNPWDQSLTVNVGADDGVQAGMTVMGATGVIGQVSRVTSSTAVIRMLTDPSSGVAVMIQSSRETGIVRGTAGSMLMLEDLGEDVIPQVGDVIVSSGLGGSYQRGLIVGSVVSVNKTAANPEGSVVVKPNGTAKVLEEVIIVFSAPDVKMSSDKTKAKQTQEQTSDDTQNQTSADDQGYEDVQVSNQDEG